MYDDFENFKASHSGLKDLVEFHQSYKFMLQAKHDMMYRELGQIVGNHEGLEFSEILRQYEILFKIGKINKKRGYKPINVIQFLRDFASYLRQASNYPKAL